MFYFPSSGLVDGERGRSWAHISAANEGNSNNYGDAVPKASRL